MNQKADDRTGWAVHSVRRQTARGAHGPPYTACYIATRPPMSRRTFLRGAGVVLALPWLEAMSPTFVRAQAASTRAPGDGKPRRMLAVNNNIGFYPSNFFPTGEGRNYVASPYLELIQRHRDDFTVFTGVSLPEVSGGFPTDTVWLTGAPHPGKATFRNSISLDQVFAQQLGYLARFPSLTLSVNTRNRSLSFDKDGRLIPPEESARALYQRLFVAGPKDETEALVRKLETDRSILDTINAQATDLQRNLAPADRERLDQYLTSVRELEQRLHRQHDWETKPKPVVSMPEPPELPPSRYFEKVKLMYDLATLAFQTESSRAITLFLDGIGTPIIEGAFAVPITHNYRVVAQHGDDSVKLAQRIELDRAQFRHLDQLLTGLKAVKEEGDTLLDRTQVLWGSNFNDVNRPHVLAGPIIGRPTRPDANMNLPIVFAGGGWKHGQHLVFDTERNYPLTNLHLSMLHRMGINSDKFSSSTGTFAGLEMV